MPEDTMHAAVFEGEGRLSLKRIPRPGCSKPDDVLLRVQAAGICGTDVHILSVPPRYPGKPGTVLGHEYCGTVVEIGSEVFHVKPGDRVVIDPNLTCGVCRYCRRGLPNMCERITALGVQLNGGFAEYCLAPAKAVHKIDESVPPEKALFAEPISCILNAASRVRFVPGMTVVVFGAGPIGQLFIQYFRAAGAGLIIAVEPSSYRARAAADGGAHVVLDPSVCNVAREVLRISDGGCDIAVDAVGSVLLAALECVRKGGRVLAIGINQEASVTLPQHLLTMNEKAVLGTFIANLTFQPAISILERGIFQLEKIITHMIPLSEIHTGLQLMRSGDCLKVVVVPQA